MAKYIILMLSAVLAGGMLVANPAVSGDSPYEKAVFYVQ